MPQRNSELPEGTDHIINGALETGGAGGATGGAGGGASGTGAGFIGAGEGSAISDDTGGTAVATTTTATTTTGQGGNAMDQLRDNASNLRDQATTKVREFADQGKTRATEALEEFSRVVDDAATSIDERLGAEYGQYARRAADAVSDFAETLRNKEVDELYDGAANLVRKSPAVAIGVAAAVGFGLVRLIKSGLPEEQVDVEFEPDLAAGRTTGSTSQIDVGASTGGGTSTGGTGTGGSFGGPAGGTTGSGI